MWYPFCVCGFEVLRRQTKCFVYARKVFCAGSQGCEIPSPPLLATLSYLTGSLAHPCKHPFRTISGAEPI